MKANKKDIKEELEELEELIELAEKVSENIKKLEYGRLTYKLSIIGVTIVTFIFLFFLFSKSTQGLAFATVVFSMLILFLSFIITLLFIRKASLIKDEIHSEIMVSKKLLKMIYSVKDSLSKDVGVVSKAIIEMKLNRISFSNKSTQKRSREYEEQHRKT